MLNLKILLQGINFMNLYRNKFFPVSAFTCFKQIGEKGTSKRHYKVIISNKTYETIDCLKQIFESNLIEQFFFKTFLRI